MRLNDRPSIPQVDKHIPTEIQQQPDQHDVVDDDHDLAYQSMRQQPDRQPRNEGEDHDRRDYRARVMDEKLDRLDIDPTLDCPEASYRIADGERKAVLPLPAIGRAEPEELATWLWRFCWSGLGGTSTVDHVHSQEGEIS